MASRDLLKGCFAGTVLVLFGSAASFQALAVTRLIECANGSVPATPRATAKSPARPPLTRSAAPLFERNVFDSRTGALAPRTVTLHADDVGDPLAAPMCDSPQLYIVSESDDQRSSLATLRAAGELQPHLRRVGDEVANQRVEYIGFNPRQGTPAVWLSSGRALCQAVLFARNSEAPREHEVPVERSAARSSSAPTEQPERLRIVPELAAGKLLGVRLFGIQPSGAFAAVGLQNGDRLEAINGLEMNSPEHALALYATLRSTSDFHLRIARGRERRPIAITLHLK